MQEKESKTNSHFYLSIIKSGIRFAACYFLFNSQLPIGASLLAFAEVIGIAEEIF